MIEMDEMVHDTIVKHEHNGVHVCYVRIEYGNAKSKCNIQTTKIKFILEMKHQRLQEKTTVGQSA